MQEKEHRYYENIGNWDFDQIKYKTEKQTNWDFYEKIKVYTNKDSICLDLGTGGGDYLIVIIRVVLKGIELPHKAIIKGLTCIHRGAMRIERAKRV